MNAAIPAVSDAVSSAASRAATAALDSKALANLRDIHLPDAVGIWPLAPGWWVLLAAVVAIAIGVHLWVRAQRRSLKRAALRELDTIAARLRNGEDVSDPALRLAILLRRVAIARFPRRDVASLYGAEWSEFLMRTSRDSGLTEGMARELSSAIYSGPSAAPSAEHVEAWITGARQWIGGNA